MRGEEELRDEEQQAATAAARRFAAAAARRRGSRGGSLGSSCPPPRDSAPPHQRLGGARQQEGQPEPVGPDARVLGVRRVEADGGAPEVSAGGAARTGLERRARRRGRGRQRGMLLLLLLLQLRWPRRTLRRWGRPRWSDCSGRWGRGLLLLLPPPRPRRSTGVIRGHRCRGQSRRCFRFSSSVCYSNSSSRSFRVRLAAAARACTPHS